MKIYPIIPIKVPSIIAAIKRRGKMISAKNIIELIKSFLNILSLINVKRINIKPLIIVRLIIAIAIASGSCALEREENPIF